MLTILKRIPNYVLPAETTNIGTGICWNRSCWLIHYLPRTGASRWALAAKSDSQNPASQTAQNNVNKVKVLGTELETCWQLPNSTDKIRGKVSQQLSQLGKKLLFLIYNQLTLNRQLTWKVATELLSFSEVAPVAPLAASPLLPGSSFPLLSSPPSRYFLKFFRLSAATQFRSW